MQVGAEKLCDEVDILERRNEDIAKRDDLGGYQRTSTRLIMKRGRQKRAQTYVLMSQVLEQLQLTVCSLGENGSAEGLHNLLDGNILVGKLVTGGAASEEDVSASTDRWSQRALVAMDGIFSD